MKVVVDIYQAMYHLTVSESVPSKQFFYGGPNERLFIHILYTS